MNEEYQPLVGGSRARASSVASSAGMYGASVRSSMARPCYSPYLTTRGMTVAMSAATVQRRHGFLHRTLHITLRDGSAIFQPGCVHAVASPSDKVVRSILNVLAGTRAPLKGRVTADNIPVVSSLFRFSVGFADSCLVPFTQLSNRANVAIRLRSRRRCASTAEVDERVEDVLRIVGLDGDKRGSRNSRFENAILHIACELVCDPPVLFVANIEPNLEYHLHGRLSRILRDVAALGKTVFVGCTQLPLSIYQHIDTLLLVGVNGYVFYAGRVDQVGPYFTSLDISVSEEHLPQDELDAALWAPDTVRASRYALAERQTSLTIDDGETTIDLATAWSEDHFLEDAYAAKFATSSIARAAAASMQRAAAAAPSRNIELWQLRPNVFSRGWASVVGDVHNAARSIELYVIFIIVTALLLFSGLIVSHQTLTQGGMQNIRGIVFFLFFVLLELNSLFVESFLSEVRVFIEQRNSGTTNALTHVTYVMAKMALARILLIVVVLGFILYAVRVVGGILVLMWAITSFAHALLLYTLVAVTLNARIVRLASFAITAIAALFSGFLINLTSVPVFFGYISIVRFGYGLTLNRYLANQPYSCDNTVANVTSYCYTGDQYLALEGFTGDTERSAISALVGFSAWVGLICCVRLHMMRR